MWWMIWWPPTPSSTSRGSTLTTWSSSSEFGSSVGWGVICSTLLLPLLGCGFRGGLRWLCPTLRQHQLLTRSPPGAKQEPSASCVTPSDHANLHIK